MKRLFVFAIVIIQFTIAAAQVQDDKPLLTIACMSDVHIADAANTSLNNIKLRNVFTNAVKKIHQDEKIDVMIIGGDCSSDLKIDQTRWEKVRDLYANACRSAFPDGVATPVVYVTGNHEYEFGRGDSYKNYNSGDFYTYPMSVDIGELLPEECFYETPNNGSGPTLPLLAAYHYTIKGFHFLVLNCGKYFFSSSSDYRYSVESVRWIANKLEEICKDDPNRTIFFSLHLPFGDSNFLRQPSKGIASCDGETLLKETLSKYPNLIMLYGHDHGGDRAYSRRRSSQRMTLYDTYGNVIPTQDATHVEGPTEDPENDCKEYIADHYVYNEANKMYINYQSNLTLTDSPGEKVKFMNNLNGFFNMFIHSESIHYSSNGYFSHGTASPFLIMEVPSPNKVIKAHRVDSIKPGKQYMIVTKTGAAYYAIRAVKTSADDGSPRISATKVTVRGDSVISTIISKYEEVLWTIKNEVEEDFHNIYLSAHDTGKYLGHDGNNLGVVSTPVYCKFVLKDTIAKSFSLSPEKKLSEYVYSGTNGNFSCNPSDDYPLYFYKVTDPLAKTLECIKTDDPTQVGTYVIVQQNKNNTSKYYILTTTHTSSNRMQAKLLPELKDTLRLVLTKGDMWDVVKLNKEKEIGAPSFMSAFMGSMRYYTNAMNGDYLPVADPEVAQALFMYVYSDRVEFKMKNYNRSGIISGIKISKELAPFYSYRKVEPITGVGSVLKDDVLKNNTIRYNLWGQYSKGSGVVIDSRKKYIK
ncbi:MAG: metallophosphoesterase [Prevotellaceae bacterium]|nr:metallophosphoesterase [Candidatus Faecinaster equi]